MELTQLHSFRPIEDLAGVLRSVIPAAALHRRASLVTGVTGPWRPADLWHGAPERLVWTARFEGDVLFSPAGEEMVGGPLARRQAPITPAELIAPRFDGLVLVHSDAAKLAYVAVYRERHLAWSLLLQDRVRTVRCDGEVVMVEAPPRFVPEVDRAGVVLAGLRQWLREPIDVPAEGRLVLVDTLGALGEGEGETLIQDGEWAGERREWRRKLA